MRLIDADALIAELKSCHCPGAPYVDAGISIAIGKVCNATTIGPERKTGRWIEHEWAEEVGGMLISNYECSKCHCWKRETSDFCPDCGADMRDQGKGGYNFEGDK